MPYEANEIILNPFQYKTMIEVYNQGNVRRCANNENFGVKCLTSSFLEKFNSGIKLINSALILFLFSDEEHTYIQERRETLEKIQQRLSEKDIRRAVPPEENEKIFKKIALKQGCLSWNEKFKKILDSSNTWENAIETNNKISKIYEEWKRLSSTACWNNSQLSYIAFQVLPELQRQQQQALEEIQQKRAKIPKDIYQNCGNYLLEFGEKIQRLQEDIAYSILFRLKLFDQQGKISNIVKKTFDTLIMRKVLEIHVEPHPDLIKALAEEDPITPEMFHNFHVYISKYLPSQLLNTKLNRFSWFKNKGKLPLPIKKMEIGKEIFIIPAKLEHLIPAKKKFPQWLFKGAVFRWDFFKEKLYFFAVINRLSEEQSEALLSSNHFNDFQKIYSCLKKKDDYLTREIKSALAPVKEFNRFFHRQTINFIKSWKTILCEMHLQTIEKKVELAKMISLQLNEYYRASLDNFPWEKCHLLQKIVSELEEFFSPTSNNLKENDLKKQFYSLKEHSIHILSANEAITIFSKCSRMKPITDAECIYLIQYENTLGMDRENPKRHNAFLCTSLPYIKKMIEGMSIALKDARMTGRRISELNFKGFTEYYKILTHLEPPGAKEILNKMILKYFVYFMQEVVLQRFPKDKVEIFENFFLVVGNSIALNGRTIRNYVEEFKEARMKFGFSVVYPTKCRSRLEQFAEYLQINRFEKEFQILEKRVQSILRSPEFDERNETFLRIRNQLIEKESTVELSINTLQPYEKALVGVGCEKFEPIKDILNISAQAHIVKRKLTERHIPFLDKVKLIRGLNFYMTEASRENSKITETKGFTLTNSGKRPLFTKFYTDSDALMEADFHEVSNRKLGQRR